MMSGKSQTPDRLLASVALIFLVVRAGVYWWAFPGLVGDGPKRFPQAWNAWDAVHYCTIAEHGYYPEHLPEATRAFISRFPPLYPFLVRVAAGVTGLGYPAAGILVSLAAFFLASIFLAKIVVAEGGSRAAGFVAVAAFNLFPTSYFAQAPYSEGVFLLLLAWYFWLVRENGNFLVASAVAMLLPLTRSAGVAIIPVHLLVAFERMRNRGGEAGTSEFKIGDLLACGLPVMGAAGQYAITRCFLRLPGYFASSDKSTFKLDAPYPFSETVSSLGSLLLEPGKWMDERFMMTLGWSAVFMFAGLLVAVIGIRALRARYSVFLWASFGMLSMLTWDVSVPRYLFSFLPIYMVIGRVKSPVVLGTIFAVFGIGLAVFSRKFVAGSWAF